MKEIQIYKSGIFRKGWRWRIKADNGNIIAAATESYKNLEDCRANILSIHHILKQYFEDAK